MKALILFRHGNTFEAGQTPVWVGARTDMPLTQEGEAQANAAARYVQRHGGGLDAIIAGPLQRTSRFAEIIGTAMGKPVSIDERLCEIDYGLWEGLSNDAVTQRFSAQSLASWQENGQWPEGMNWSPPLDVILENLRGFLREQHEKLKSGAKSRLAVTSNGILRLIHRLVTHQIAGNEAKVKTGNFCVLAPEGEGWKIEGWNTNPAL